ncbi:hypothetical protein GYB22_06235 [bacterium]|nr:hypothetical protein [bacterium]
MRNFRLLAVLLTCFAFTASNAQVGSYFSKFRPSKKWSVGLQVGPTMFNGDADDVTLGLAYGLHVKYSVAQSFGLKLSGNMGTLNGGRMDPDFSGNKNDGRNGATTIKDQVDNNLYHKGSAAPSTDGYVFTNNFRDLDLTAVYTLGNLSFLRPLRSVQLFMFFGVGALWSDVVGTFEGDDEVEDYITGQMVPQYTRDARAYYRNWGPAYWQAFDADGNEIDPSIDPVDASPDIANVETYYQGRNLTIPFGLGLKYNINKLLDLGLEWKSHWTRNDLIDGFSFPTQRNRSYDYYHMLTVQLSVKLGTKGNDNHYDWLNPMETVYADMDSMKNEIEELKPLKEDQDGDGVSDYFDADNETEEDCDKVYGNGKAVDSDGDGVADCKDLEPFSDCDDVDENGVAKDSDGDGVADCVDEQDDTPMGSLVDVKGNAIEINDACCDCENVVLPSIIFDNGSSKIPSSSYGILYMIAEKMKQCPELTITAIGHASSKPAEQLAWKRSNAIIDHLEANYGIDRSRIGVDYSSGASGEYSSRRIDLTKGSGGSSAPPAPGM